MSQTEDASVRTVVVAVAANLLIAVAKGVAAASRPWKAPATPSTP